MEIINFLWFVVKVLALVFAISFLFELFLEVVIMTPIRNHRAEKRENEMHEQIIKLLKSEKGIDLLFGNLKGIDTEEEIED